MTKNEIIAMATEAGLCYPSNGYVDWIDAGPGLPELTYFASLVAEQERRECAKLCAEVGMWPLVHEIEARGET